MEITKKIAYQTVDKEGDVWCNHAMLFDNDEDARKFFTNKNNVFKALDYEVNGENINDIEFKIYDDNPAKCIEAVTFECEYAGEVVIKRMSEAVIIKYPNDF